MNTLTAEPTLIDSTSLCIGKDMVPVIFLSKDFEIPLPSLPTKIAIFELSLVLNND
jgi:hypothetical protein